MFTCSIDKKGDSCDKTIAFVETRKISSVEKVHGQRIKEHIRDITMEQAIRIYEAVDVLRTKHLTKENTTETPETPPTVSPVGIPLSNKVFFVKNDEDDAIRRVVNKYHQILGQYPGCEKDLIIKDLMHWANKHPSMRWETILQPPIKL